MLEATIEAFAVWANSIAGLAVARPEDRLHAVRLNEAATSRAMYLWNQSGPSFQMVKPHRIWLR